MFDVNIDREAGAPLHEQVAAQIRRAIADGEAKSGERLPPARHLAAVMNVNTNTVLRALRLLRDEGLLELRQGSGIRVIASAEHSTIVTKVAELVQIGARHGYTPVELAQMVAVTHPQRGDLRKAPSLPNHNAIEQEPMPRRPHWHAA